MDAAARIAQLEQELAAEKASRQRLERALEDAMASVRAAADDRKAIESRRAADRERRRAADRRKLDQLTAASRDVRRESSREAHVSAPSPSLPPPSSSPSLSDPISPPPISSPIPPSPLKNQGVAGELADGIQAVLRESDASWQWTGAREQHLRLVLAIPGATQEEILRRLRIAIVTTFPRFLNLKSLAENWEAYSRPQPVNGPSPPGKPKRELDPNDYREGRVDRL